MANGRPIAKKGRMKEKQGRRKDTYNPGRSVYVLPSISIERKTRGRSPVFACITENLPRGSYIHTYTHDFNNFSTKKVARIPGLPTTLSLLFYFDCSLFPRKRTWSRSDLIFLRVEETLKIYLFRLIQRSIFLRSKRGEGGERSGRIVVLSDHEKIKNLFST